MNLFHSDIVYAAATVTCAGIGAGFDIKSRRVPNLLTGPGILLALLLHGLVGGWKDLGSAALAGLICGLVFLIFYLAGGMGAGDVKLITAAGCFAGSSHAAYLLIFTALAGGAMALALVLYRGKLRQTVANVGELVSHHRLHGLQPHPDLNVLNANTLRLPYAVAIAAGSAITMLLQVAQG